MSSKLDPKKEYGDRLRQRRDKAARCAKGDSRFANARLLVFAVLLALMLAAYFYPQVSWAWLWVPVLVFVGLMVAHGRLLREKERCESAIDHYEAALARLDGRWVGHGKPGADLAPPDHLYANDLDLFGPGSLFELLCMAKTREGERALAAWLCDPAPLETIHARQEAVEELRNRLDLREDLALLGGHVRKGVEPHALRNWSSAPAVLSPRPPVTAWLLPAAAVITLGFLIKTGIGAPFFIVLAIELVYSRLHKKRLHEVMESVQEPSRELRVLAEALHRLEQEHFTTSLLAGLRNTLRQEGREASRAIARLDRLTDLHEMQHNIIFGPIAFVLLWGEHVAHAIERWRLRFGRHVPEWLDALGELEALCSLSAYAFEHPNDPFPEFAETGPRYEGKGLGHPLLPESTCVRNDVRLGEGLQLMLISGSNMSGKSTLLRTVGVNAVLAHAGAPVRAERLTLSPLQLGASLRTQDSLWQGTSRFYAELLRLKQMIEAAQGPSPLLFLLDELLHGTNSHDRRIGADALLKALVESGAIGLATTHDLAVTHVVDRLDGHATNVHFTDKLVNEKLEFDYKLKPGVVTEGNALKLMRNLGLPI
ncbi:MAG: DNA mismatch repair protein MutS [FCB group bacterium]|nr:DNA mismatch repair protein MutS [FCB group bacterium]